MYYVPYPYNAYFFDLPSLLHPSILFNCSYNSSWLLFLAETYHINRGGAGQGRGLEEQQRLAVIPYVKCVSEQAYEKFNFTSNQAQLSTHFSPMWRTLEKLAGVVYQIPCQCGKVYVWKTQRHLETRVKEHMDACNKGYTEKSAIVEDQQHQVKWEDIRLLDRAPGPIQLKVKKYYTSKWPPPTTASTRTEVTSYQAAGLQPWKSWGGGVNSNRANTIRISASTSAPELDRMRAQAQEPHL